MPSRKTTQKAKQDLREGYSASTAAGEFVHEEMHHKKQGKHGPESRRQAIAIGLSKARRAGVPIKRRPSSKARGTRKSTSGSRRKTTRSRPRTSGRTKRAAASRRRVVR